jgi:tripartite-type tricarboxylate transporter receptor subunit TctC
MLRRGFCACYIPAPEKAESEMRDAMRWVMGCLGAVLLASSPVAWSAAGPWKPEKTVEIVAPSGPGGTTDRTARVVARILTQHKLV